MKKTESCATVPLNVVLKQSFCLIPVYGTDIPVVDSVADPGCLSRIPDPTAFYPRSQIRILQLREEQYKHPRTFFMKELIILEVNFQTKFNFSSNEI
jgi:hypothetical protein